MKEWMVNIKKRTTIVQELHELVPGNNIFVDGEVHAANWSLQRRVQVHQCDDGNFDHGGWGTLLEVQAGQGWQELGAS